jgi:SAM-dependent methyltransferase
MTSSEIPDRQSMSSLSSADLPIALPERAEAFAQDEEWCVARIGGEWRELRFHDYHLIYEVEGLYERLFYDVLRCSSPGKVRALLESELRRAGTAPEELRVLDLGAGNGIMGEELVALGVDAVVGVDIIPEAAEAASRDRPGVYVDYHVLDMTDLGHDDRGLLRGYDVNCLTCVAALGFGDIPPRAFAEAFNLVAEGGWIAFNIKEDFLNGRDRSGFARLIERSIDRGCFEMQVRERYPHRLATNGEPLHYVAMVGNKRKDIRDRVLA